METPEDNGLLLPHGHRPLRLAFHYPILPKASRRDLADRSAAHGYTAQIADVGGIDLRYTFDAARSRPENALPEQFVWLEWVEDPALLAASDLKAGLRLKREDEESLAFNIENEIPLP